MADVCADETQMQQLAAMAAAGIEPRVTCSTVLTTRSMETTERFVIPDNVGSVASTQCVVLEPVFSRGIYRPIPAGARVSDISAMTTARGAGLPFAAGSGAKLTAVLRANPYATADAPATDIYLHTSSLAGLNGQKEVAAATVAYSLLQDAPLTFEGLSSTFPPRSFTSLYADGTKAPCYLATDMYLAVRFDSASGTLPRDLTVQFDVTYEMPRTAEGFEPALSGA